MLFCWWREKGGHKEAKDFLKSSLIFFVPTTNMRKFTKFNKLFKSRRIALFEGPTVNGKSMKNTQNNFRKCSALLWKQRILLLTCS